MNITTYKRACRQLTLTDEKPAFGHLSNLGDCVGDFAVVETAGSITFG
jgi:hypothetical protein